MQLPTDSLADEPGARTLQRLTQAKPPPLPGGSDQDNDRKGRSADEARRPRCRGSAATLGSGEQARVLRNASDQDRHEPTAGRNRPDGSWSGLVGSVSGLRSDDSRASRADTTELPLFSRTGHPKE